MTNTTVYPDSETLYGSNPYDAHGVYDSDTVSGAGPSTERSVVAYDDPYADNYVVPALAGPDTLPFNGKPVGTNHPEAHQATSTPLQGHARGRGRGRGRGAGAGSFERGRGRGRGGGQQQRGRGRGRDNVGLHNAGRGGWSQTGNHAPQYGVSEQYDPHSSLASSGPASALGRQQRELSPTSFAIARATGQHVGGASFQPLPWQLAMQIEALGQQSHGQIQPHINPRFAAQWGMQIQTQWPSHYSQGQWSQWDQQQYGNSDRSDSDYNQ
jgi:H/ACA ribonucleoprotein complex non-core subunit NAF1